MKILKLLYLKEYVTNSTVVITVTFIGQYCVSETFIEIFSLY